jgi:phosphoadenosine phosphosulfate reductase
MYSVRIYASYTDNGAKQAYNEYVMDTIARSVKEMEQWTPQQIILWAMETFGNDVAMSSSFQQQSLALLHIVSRVTPSLPIFFVDTGYHFGETLQFKQEIARRFWLNVIDLRSEMPREEQDARYGPELWRRNPDLCCYLNKVIPMQNALRKCKAWITGIRRDQSSRRADARVVEYRDDGLVKINPLISWTQQDVWRYIEFHNLPYHPLYKQGYRSIGCAPCTRAVAEGEDERAGRWSGTEKNECGLHTVFRVR